MDVNSDKESTSIFKPFSTGSKENRNAKTTDNLAKDGEISKPTFDDFSHLPDGLKNCISDGFIGQPLEDIDPYYSNKETFIAVNKNKDLFRFSSSKALLLFTPNNVIRRTAIRILIHPWYTMFMTAVVLVFCVINASVLTFDLRYFLIAFLIDSILNIISYGLLLSPFSYLRSGWNILDTILNILLLCGILVLAELRVLKIISFSVNLRQTTGFYWSSFKALRDLVLYICLMLCLTSTFLLSMYMGTLTQKCIENGSSGQNISDINDDGIHCGNSSGSQHCPENYVCLGSSGNNPDFGYTNFDTIFGSLLSSFRLITRDYWENLLHLIIATNGPWHVVFFIQIIFFGSFQLFSVIWGQIAVSYNYMKLKQWENSLMPDQLEIDDDTQKTGRKDENMGCWSKFQRFFFYIIFNPYVALFVIICIVLNTLCMALDHHGMVREMDKILRLANYTFVLVFVFEAVLKLLALGIIRYFKDAWNSFDFVIALVGFIELGLEGIQGLSVLRSFRLLRPLRLAKIVPAFDLLLTRIQHLFSLIVGQTIIFLMFIYVFVVFGARQFGSYYGSFNYEDDGTEIPLWRFTDAFHSFMVVFRALCGEWIETLFLCLQVTRGTPIFVYIYYICLVIMGTFLMMHLFVALIFTNDDSSALPEIRKKQQAIEKATKPKEKFHLRTYLKEKLLEPSVKKQFDEYEPKRDVESVGKRNDTPTKMVTNSGSENDDTETINHTETSIAIEPAPSINISDKSLRITESKYYRLFVTIYVLVASLSLALQYEINSESRPVLKSASIYIEYIFIALMCIAFLTKLASHGWNGLKDIWCWVDLFNLIVTIIGLFFVSRTVQVLLALRPLSFISRCHSLRIVATTIAKQTWLLSNTLLICLAFWLIFAIMGVQLFAGKFYQCVDSHDNLVDVEKVSNFTNCEEPYMLVNSFMNFDNVFSSYYSLLQVSTFKGWISIINDAVNSREVFQQPIREANIYMFLYFVIFIVCGVFMCLNVLVGILVQHLLHTGSLAALLNQPARNCEATHNISEKDASGTNSTSRLINFVRSPVFDKVALAVCLIYYITLMFDHFEASYAYYVTMDYIHLVLTVLLIIEVCLRGYGLRKDFFVNSWNRFDVVVLVLVLLELSMGELVAKYAVSSHILRMIRILRFNKVITSSSKSLQFSGKVLCKTWKAVRMLFVFQFFIICIYAMIGMALFKEIPIEFDSFTIFNFRTFGQSILLLIQISTSAGWDGVLEQIAVENYFTSTVYLLSFIFISLTTILNVIILIAVEFFKEATSVDDEKTKLQSEDLSDFNEKWETFAGDHGKYMTKNMLHNFINALDTASALHLPNSNEKDVNLLGIRTTKDDTYRQRDVLIALNRVRLNKELKL